MSESTPASSSRMLPPRNLRHRSSTSNASTQVFSSLTSSSNTQETSSIDTSDADDNTSTTWSAQTEIVKLKYSSEEYNMFKPKRTGSLYYEIMKNSDRLQDTAEYWINCYQEQPHAARILFLQFIVDLMGFQNVKIDDFIKESVDPDFKTLFKHLEGKCTKLHKEFQWVLNLRSSFSKDFYRVVQLFLHELIVKCHFAEILYDYEFYSSVSYFLREATHSKCRVIKYNTVVIAAKLCSEYSYVIKLIENKKNNTLGMDVFGEDDEEKLTKLHNTNEFFWYAQAKTCNIEDEIYNFMRKIIAQEIEHRLNLNIISTIRSDKFISVIRKLLGDSKPYVRVLAIRSCYILFSKDHYLTALSSDDMKIDRNKLLIDMETRLSDINNQVQVATFRFYTICIKKYPSCVKNFIQMYILKRLISKYPIVAKESALFFTAYVRNADQNYAAALKLFIKTTELAEFTGQFGLIVDSLIDYFDELKNLDALVNLLLLDLDIFTDEEYIKLVETLYHVVYVLVKGQCEIGRGKARKAVQCNKNNILVAEVLFKNMGNLLDVYEDIDECLELFFKTFELLNFNENKFMVYKEEIGDILTRMLTLTENGKNPKLEQVMFQALGKISLIDNPLKDIAICIFEKYFRELTERYISNIDQMDQIEDSEDVPLATYHEVEAGARILAVGLKHYNFTKYLNWNQIYENWTVSLQSESINCNQMNICCHYLVWQVKMLFHSRTFNVGNVNTVNQMTKTYLDTCMILLNTASSKMKRTALQCITDLATGFLIVNNEEADERLKALAIEFIEENEAILIDFVQKCCFKPIEGTLSQRRNCLNEYLMLILQGSVDIKYFPHILVHYVNFENYKDIFIEALNELKKRSLKSLCVVVLHTLMRIYSGEGDTIMKGRLFVTSLLKLLPENVCAMMLQMAIIYVKKQKKTSFVKCLEPLIPKLSIDNRKNAIKYMRDNLNKTLLDDINIRHFKKYIQMNKGVPIDADENEQEVNTEISEEFSSITIS